MKNKSNLPEELQKEVEGFFEYVQPQRLSRGLRNLLLTYLSVYQDGHSMDLEDLLIDMQWLFELLDTAEDMLKS